MNDLQLTKQCTGACKRQLPATEEFFNEHSSGKYGFQPRCKECKYEENKVFRLANPKNGNQLKTEWVKRNPQKRKEAVNKWARSEVGKAAAKKNWLDYKYGLTEDDYQALFVSQNGCCAICKQQEKITSRLHVDHDHEKYVVRGLLCGTCNRGLGMFYDKKELLQNAIKYLEHLVR